MRHPVLGLSWKEYEDSPKNNSDVTQVQPQTSSKKRVVPWAFELDF